MCVLRVPALAKPWHAQVMPFILVKQIQIELKMKSPLILCARGAFTTFVCISSSAGLPRRRDDMVCDMCVPRRVTTTTYVCVCVCICLHCSLLYCLAIIAYIAKAFNTHNIRPVAETRAVRFLFECVCVDDGVRTWSVCHVRITVIRSFATNDALICGATHTHTHLLYI